MTTPEDPQPITETESTTTEDSPRPEAPASAESVAAASTVGRPHPKTRSKAAGVRKVATARPKRPAGASTPRTPSSHSQADEPEAGFFKKNAPMLTIVTIVALGGAYLAFKKPGTSSPAPVKQERMVMIAPLPPLPPPPPPPPPPPQQKPPEEKMEKETAAVEEPKADPKPEPVKAPPAPSELGTGLKGDGPGIGLSNGNGIGGGTIGGGGSGKTASRFGWYAGQVQSRIADALRKHPKTKNASMRLEVRVWPDSTGRITRAQLAGSSGDSAVDEAIQNGVLTGLQLQEPPPAGMRLPIVLRLTAQRPSH